MTPLRAKLWNPPNAKPDPGYGIPRHAPEKAVQEIFEMPRGVLARYPRFETDKPKTVLPPRTKEDPWIVPYACRWTTELGHDPEIPKSADLTPRHILLCVAKVWNLQPSYLTCRRHTQFLVWPRQVAMTLIYHLCPNFSFAKIGQLFGGRDHSTVIHAANKMQHHIDAVARQMKDSRDGEAWAQAMKARLRA